MPMLEHESPNILIGLGGNGGGNSYKASADLALDKWVSNFLVSELLKM